MVPATSEPSQNGHAHHCNGHVPVNRLAAAASEPLDTVSTASEGRTARGTFAPGNTFARGNPTARRMAALRTALLSSLTAETMAALGQQLLTLAMAGDLAAMKLLLSYALGRPPDALDPDGLDLAEWRAIQDAPTAEDFVRLVKAGADTARLAALFNELRPGGTQKILDALDRTRDVRDARAAVDTDDTED